MLTFSVFCIKTLFFSSSFTSSLPLSETSSYHPMPFAVTFKTDCDHSSHIKLEELQPLVIPLLTDNFLQPCKQCNLDIENWICLTCGEIHCSREINSHMIDHNQNTQHPVVLSLLDLSAWCYLCDCYIINPQINMARSILSRLKPGGGLRGLSIPDQTFPSPSPLPHIDDLPHDLIEYEDSREILEEKVQLLASAIQTCQRSIVFTGAGISTSSGIPDYRGPRGIWTRIQQGEKIAEDELKDLSQFEPTLAHRAIKTLMDKNLIQHVISTNIDGLHRKSGVESNQLSELHGNGLEEICDGCHRSYFRDHSVFDMKSFLSIPIDGGCSPSVDHSTGRKCDFCGSDLKDTIVYFHELLKEEVVTKALAIAKDAELSIVLGSRLSVSPACNIAVSPKNVVIINRQKTKFDDFCVLRLWAATDLVLDRLLHYLSLPSSTDCSFSTEQKSK